MWFNPEETKLSTICERGADLLIYLFNFTPDWFELILFLPAVFFFENSNMSGKKNVHVCLSNAKMN